MILALVLGVLGGSGALLCASGWRRVPATTSWFRRRVDGLALDPTDIVIPGGVCLAVLILTRWPAAALVGAIAGRFLANRRRPRVDEAERAEAIALLIEQLKNAAGAADGVETVLGNAARHAPALIRDDVERGTARLAYAPLEVVLDDLAEALAHPSSDQVVRAMGQVASQGGSLHDALDRLARRTQGLAEMHRRIEVARAQPRTTMRTVTAVIAIFTVLLFLAAPDWMAAYGTALGQLVLLLVAGWFAIWFHQMGRMARIEPVARPYQKRVTP